MLTSARDFVTGERAGRSRDGCRGVPRVGLCPGPLARPRRCRCVFVPSAWRWLVPLSASLPAGGVWCGGGVVAGRWLVPGPLRSPGRDLWRWT